MGLVWICVLVLSGVRHLKRSGTTLQFKKKKGFLIGNIIIAINPRIYFLFPTASLDYNTTSSSLLPHAQAGDAGVFTCVATNAGGSARQDVHLSINMRPAFKELPGDVTLNKGQSLALSCHAQGTPAPLISWNFNNSPYQGNFFAQDARLRMESLALRRSAAFTSLQEPPWMKLAGARWSSTM